MLVGDTICAISTPPGRGGIGVIRLSGPDALQFALDVFRAPPGSAFDNPNRAQLGSIVDPRTGIKIDQAVATWFKAPRSYTGEDVVELSCHGSPPVLAQVLELLTTRGARIAEPGEFTYRAFFNRRIDLTQAQAVRDLIDAQTQYQALVAGRQLEGALSSRLNPFKESLIEIIVQLESSVEFVEDDLTIEAESGLLKRIEHLIAGLRELEKSFSFGKFVREGFDLSIVGRPNVGKSSVFNRLIGSDRAIVTEVPGTTRDALYETTSISGVPVRLIDTAGIRETSDVVESIGISRTRAAIADADIVLLVIDRSEPLTIEDQNLVESLENRNAIVALNKCDLPEATGSSAIARLCASAIEISALSGQGFDLLTRGIFDRLAGEAGPEREDVLVTDARQHAAVRAALTSLDVALGLLKGGELEEIILLKLRGALESLGEITGETLNEDILGQIFSTFCIGK